MEPLIFLEFKASYRRDAIMPTQMLLSANPLAQDESCRGGYSL